jgi:hypothetical protein
VKTAPDPSPAAARERHRERLRARTRQSILEAAEALVPRAGLGALTLDGIAAELGLTKQGLYYHYASKEALVAEPIECTDRPKASCATRWPPVVRRSHWIHGGSPSSPTRRRWGCWRCSRWSAMSTTRCAILKRGLSTNCAACCGWRSVRAIDVAADARLTLAVPPDRPGAAGTLHADATPVPVLQPGRGATKTGRLWTHVRAGRPAGGVVPPAVRMRYTPDRKAVHPAEHLAGFGGILQADGCAGFERLYETGQSTEAACWAPVRRTFHDREQATGSPIAKQAIDHVYELLPWKLAAAAACDDRLAA